jgi:hypothetical protein
MMRRFPPSRIVCLTEETVETLYLYVRLNLWSERPSAEWPQLVNVRDEAARRLVAAYHRSAPGRNRLLDRALTRQRNGSGEKPAVRPKSHPA